MEVRHLRYFLAVAEELHFSRAAERLHMAQPPLSARIKELERELGQLLFERSPRGVSLTDAGRSLVPLAREAVESFDRALRFRTTDTASATRTLRVGITPDTTPKAIEDFTKSVHAAAPSLSLEIVEGHSSQQLEQLRRGEIDLGLLRHPFPTNGLHVRPPLSTPVGALMAANHPLAQRRTLFAEDLAPYPLVLFPRAAAPAHYDELLAALATHGLQNAKLRHATRILHALLLTEQAIALRNVGTVHRSDQPDLVWRAIGGHFLSWHTSVVWPAASEHPAVRLGANALTAALVNNDNWLAQEAARPTGDALP